MLRFIIVMNDVMQIQLHLPASQSVFYYPCQYLNLLLKGGAERSYSMANPPNEDNTVTLHIRHMPGGLFTDSLFGATQPAIKEIGRASCRERVKNSVMKGV